MNARHENLKEFLVVGIEARTSSVREMTGEGIIGKQWQRVMQDRLVENIPNRIGQNLYSVYSDYESDARGEYSFLIGVQVSRADAVPSGLVSKKILGGR